jgi:hypothetical protein
MEAPKRGDGMKLSKSRRKMENESDEIDRVVAALTAKKETLMIKLGAVTGHGKFWTVTEPDLSIGFKTEEKHMASDDSPAYRYVGRMLAAYHKLVPYLRVTHIGDFLRMKKAVDRSHGPWRRCADGISAVVWETATDWPHPTFEQFFDAYGGHDAIQRYTR